MAYLKGKSGYLPCQLIEQVLRQGMIQSREPIHDSQIQPVSLDLRLGPKAFRHNLEVPLNNQVELF